MEHHMGSKEKLYFFRVGKDFIDRLAVAASSAIPIPRSQPVAIALQPSQGRLSC